MRMMSRTRRRPVIQASLAALLLALLAATALTLSLPSRDAARATPAGMAHAIGAFSPATATFYLRNTLSGGNADEVISLGTSSMIPIAGDWTGKGFDSVGVYDPSNGQWWLKDANTQVAPVTHAFTYGPPSSIPLVGDWTGAGHDSIGVYYPPNHTFYLRNSVSGGNADTVVNLGFAGAVPIAGDWLGVGSAGIGVYNPVNGVFYLKVNLTSANADYAVIFGPPGASPVAADWSGIGSSGIGVYTNGVFYARSDAKTSGNANYAFAYGASGMTPLAGVWTAQPPPTPTPTPVHSLGVASATDLGAVHAPATVLARDGGATALIGGKLLWTFGDTLLTTAPVNPPPGFIPNILTDTAALADPASPLATSEPLDAHGVPVNQLIPFTASEAAYNTGPGAGPNNRYALWPSSVIPDGSGNGLVFYTELKVVGPLTYQPVGISVARVGPNATTSVRLVDQLFGPTEPAFANAMVNRGMVYIYGLQPTTQNVVVARAPLVSVTSRGAYAFWNGSAWDGDVTHAATLFGNVPGAVSVSFNPYLGKYLAVHSGTFLYQPNKVLLLSASRPQGPWSSDLVAFTGMAPATGIDYAGIEHPELDLSGGQTLLISYYNPTGTFTGTLRLVSVSLS